MASALPDLPYRAEYAKSGRSRCKICKTLIADKELRIATITQSSRFDGKMQTWFHKECFLNAKKKPKSVADIANFDSLRWEDQESIRKEIEPEVAINSGNDNSANSKRKTEASADSKPISSKKFKTETVVDATKDQNKAKEQNQKMFEFRDKLQQNFAVRSLAELLRYNEQEIPEGSGQQAMLDQLSDIMTFGALMPCKTCDKGQFVFMSGVGYQCTGHINEFTRCAQVTQNPERTVFKVPEDYKDDFLEEFVVGTRIIPMTPASTSGASSAKSNSKPLRNLKVCFVGESNESDQIALKAKVKLYGGLLRVRMSDKISLLIATTDDVNDVKNQRALDVARTHKIPLVSSEFVNRIKEEMVVSEEIMQTLLPNCDWVKPDEVTTGLEQLNSEVEGKKRSKLELRMDAKIKLTTKNGAVVDPDSGLEKIGHVFKVGSTFYNSVLNKTDVDSGQNSFYRLQIIESDLKNMYYVFRSWGRIGTSIGGKWKSDALSCDEAIKLFKKLYSEKTQNVFGEQFVKKRGCYLPMEIDYGDEDTFTKFTPNKIESKLPMPIQELISLICNIDNMNSALLEFELDIEKMPLGKLSRNQILKAYGILSEALDLLNADSKKPDLGRLLVDVSNRFYNLIPHNFGTSLPTILDNRDVLKSKLVMLENLMEIELAYELLRDDDDNSQGISRVDKHYAKLNTNLSVVETKSVQYEVIQRYLVNTHAATHKDYKLEIEGIFKVTRSGESARFEKFSQMENRKLLWHGSRTTNFVGILSQGLRIAPPEAPVTGYMFGKGIYFADMVTKSGNYCYTSREKTTGLLMLCEVALGKMCELEGAVENLARAPPGFDSVKGLGQTQPDPNDKTILDGIEVPFGKSVHSNVEYSQLLYNEYIVYDPAQVKIRYLVKCNFNYNYKN